MEQKTNVIKKNDYEKYEILIPFPSLSGKRRNQFLCSELEKRHPCFSDEYAFDKVLKRIGRKGVYSDVLVINKQKLAEYERKRSLSGTGFFIDEKQNGNKLKARHRYFLSSKWKITQWSFIAFIIIVLTGILCGKLAGNSLSVSTNTFDSEVTNINSAVIENKLESIQDTSIDIKSLFEVVGAGDGKISRFEWKSDGYIQRLKANISGIFPEQFSDFSNYIEDSIIYEKGIPQFTISWSKRILQNNNNTKSVKAVLSNSDFNKEIRNTILKNGAVLKEEKAPPYHIEFILTEGMSSELLFKELSKIIQDDNRSVTEISLIQTGSQQMRAGLSITEFSFSGTTFDLENIADNLKLFYRGKEKQITGNYVAAEPKEKNLFRNNTILGEIKRPDNSSIIFYKDKDGKVKKLIQTKELEK